jgi:hypothetical protein
MGWAVPLSIRQSKLRGSAGFCCKGARAVAPPPVGNLPLGLAAIEKGKATGAKTRRERDFINAMAAFYTDHDKVDHRTRVLAYLKAMEGVAQAYRNDDEAQILYAIELNVAAPHAHAHDNHETELVGT